MPAAAMTVVESADALQAWLDGLTRPGRLYVRPIALIAGDGARALIATGRALPLAGGPIAFAQLELTDRRRQVPIPVAVAAAVPALAPLIARLTDKRPPIPGLGQEWPIIMGVINVTPDSFSDGGAFAAPAVAIEHGMAMLDAGARILDIGGESTRPGAAPIPVARELERVLPVVQGLAAAARERGAVLSIDTRNAATMTEACAAGAGMINDISALTHDPTSLEAARASGRPIVLMHMQGTPETMQQAPSYQEVALDVFDWLDGRIAAATAAGIERHRLIADVGIGFGKTVQHNHRLLARMSLFHGLGVPVLVGASRKSFIAASWRPVPPPQRVAGSLAAGLEAVRQGAQILRVHDVAETAQAVAVAKAMLAEA
jgi:dihydropteroate synthase